MESKLCLKCKIMKPLMEFHAKKKSEDGRQIYCIACKKGMDSKYYVRDKQSYKDRNNANRRKLREEIRAIKAAAGCFYCDEKEPCCLDFHHKDGKEKENTVANFVVTNSRLRALKEIQKCEVVCRNCHAKLHANFKMKEPRRLPFGSL